MVELVDDHHIEMVRRQVVETIGRQRLDRREHVIPLGGRLAVDPLFAERTVTQHMAEGGAALAQDLLAMGDEQQLGRIELGAQVAVVECGHDRLAGTSGGDDQAVRTSSPTLDLQLFQDRLLKRIRRDVERRQICCLILDGAAQGVVELGGVVGFEVVGLPVGLEGRFERADHVGVQDLAGPHVPLHAGDLGRVGQVRRADVDGRLAGVAVEEPRLGMQPGGGRVVADLDLDAQVLQLVERLGLGRAGVGGGDDPHSFAGVQVFLQGGDQVADAGPADERQHDVDAVSRVDLGFDLLAQGRLASCVGEQHGVADRGERPFDWDDVAGGVQRLDGGELADRRGERFVRGEERVCGGAVDGGHQLGGELLGRGGAVVFVHVGQRLGHPRRRQLADPLRQLGHVDLFHRSRQARSVERQQIILQRQINQPPEQPSDEVVRSAPAVRHRASLARLALSHPRRSFVQWGE